MVLLGDKIRQLREERGLSQKEVVNNIGIDRGQYSRIETNKVEPTLSTLEKIAQSFKIDLVDFFKKDAPINVDSFDKALVDRVKIVDELEPEQRQNIYAIIDMAVANNRLKKTLTNALNTNF